MEHLRGENQSSLEMVEKLRNEIISIRHVLHLTVLIFPDILFYLEKLEPC